MMRVIRFMAEDELRSFAENSIFTRRESGEFYDANTISNGYCFLKLSDWATVRRAYLHLAGVVSRTGYYAIFDVEDKFLTESFGQYFDFESFDDVRSFPEYCAVSYDASNFHLVEACKYHDGYDWESEKISLSDVMWHGTRIADVLPQ